MAGLIDADIVAYRCAAASEGDPVEVALLRTETMTMGILDKEPYYKMFLTGSRNNYPHTEKLNFRNLVNQQYKANRTKPAPIHLDACRKYLIETYGAIVCEGFEADDGCGMNQDAESVIYTIDKDLLQIPGCHYNFVTGAYREVSEVDGYRMFYKQMLIGDTSDNIFGIPLIGKVKAAKLIDHLETEEEMYDVVHTIYMDEKYNKNPEQTDGHTRFIMNADCLWIWRKEGEKFSDRPRKIY